MFAPQRSNAFFFFICSVPLFALVGCGGGQNTAVSVYLDGGSASDATQSSLFEPETSTPDFSVDAGSPDSAQGSPLSLYDGSGYCGDGIVETGEACDDGNSKPGDGCSGTCQIESGWACDAGAACVYLWVCGNGRVDPGEECDLAGQNGQPTSGCTADCHVASGYACPDAGGLCFRPALCGDGVSDPGEDCDLGAQNGQPNSGCSTQCRVNAGYECADGGASCTRVPFGLCGNGTLDTGETCDDGNAAPGDGCSGACQIEPGWACATPGSPCAFQWVCGNGRVDPGEGCDLGAQNGQANSGCTSACQVEQNFTCSGGDAGSCVPSANCGNSHLDPGEQCDTGIHNGTGGCTATCTIVAGWRCPTGGATCETICGDGVVASPYEQCDFGGGNGSGGCSATCTFQPGFACAASATHPTDCAPTACGDHIKGNLEECDDGNLRPYDGCSPTCMVEPTCNAGKCTAVCGDGQVAPGEPCDDGNTVPGDGCSATCTQEPGWTCALHTQPPTASIAIPILYRDMHYCNAADCPKNAATFFTVANSAVVPSVAANGHPDFNNDGYNIGPATGRLRLVQARLGVDNEPIFASAVGSGTGAVLTGSKEFCWWYHDVGCDSAHPNATNPYAMDVWLDGSGAPTILTLTQGAAGIYQYDNQTFFPLDGLGWDNATAALNPLWYNAPQTSAQRTAGTLRNFSFTSELHYRFTYSQAQAASATPAIFKFIGDDDVWAFINGQLVVDLGGMHDAASAQVTLNVAEAATLGLVDGGMYSIDLFQAERHVYASTYLLSLQDFVHTNSTCATMCGDGIVAGNEQCDLGTANNGAYGGCTATCTLAPYCGDGTVESPEQCDLGTAKNTGGYGACNANCTFGPVCGDGVVQGPAEMCDYGTAKNTGTYGGCKANCTLAPYCGDGVKSNDEACDLGTARNTGAYGTCSPNCTAAPFCGDAVVQSADGEVCDNGSNNVPAVAAVYGSGACTTDCKPAPSCGDGVVQSPEVCDDGAKNGSLSSLCSSSCKLKCGDGIVEAGEACDLGAGNTGAYGGCNPDCSLAAYCGDGTRQASEQCDNGSNNVAPATAYGPALCTTLCTTAPFCGDGVVESSFGEGCDGTAGCGADCHAITPP